MSDSIHAKIPSTVLRTLADYCSRQGITRDQVIVLALEQYLNQEGVAQHARSLAANLIPQESAPALQSGQVRKIVRKAFLGKRAP